MHQGTSQLRTGGLRNLEVQHPEVRIQNPWIVCCIPPNAGFQVTGSGYIPSRLKCGMPAQACRCEPGAAPAWRGGLAPWSARGPQQHLASPPRGGEPASSRGAREALAGLALTHRARLLAECGGSWNPSQPSSTSARPLSLWGSARPLSKDCGMQ